MKNVTPASDQIQPLTDGLAGINYTACARGLQLLPGLMTALCFLFLLNAGFQMGYSVPHYDGIPNVSGTHNLNFNS